MEYQEKSEDLEQYDGYGGYLEDKEDRYAPLLGYFLLDFSVLEHSLNLALAEELHGSTHEIGYVVMEKLKTFDKIELFSKLYLRLVSFQGPKGKSILAAIKKRLEDLNTFRNIIVHANWSTIDQENFVRTKIKVDTDEGYVKFRNIKITTTMIRAQSREAQRLSDDLDEFSEKTREFGFEEKQKKSS